MNDIEASKKRASHASYVLAFDTSSDMLACACAESAWSRTTERDDIQDATKFDLRVLSAHDHLCRRHANVELITTADQCMTDAHIELSQVSCIVVGRGPGSFTGVRIGIATAKGIACGMQVPLYGVSTLDSVAWNMWLAHVRGRVCVIADAMRKEVYPGVYDLTDIGVTRLFSRERVLKVDAAIEELLTRQDKDSLIFTGDGLVKYKDKFIEAGLRNICDESLWYASSQGLVYAFYQASLAHELGSGDPALVLPVYTRLSDAEENERIQLGMNAPIAAQTTGVNDELAGVHCQLRPMNVNDVPAVAALERAAHAGSHHKPYTEQMFADELSSPLRSWWICHDEGEVIGFAGARVAGDDLEILDICVASSRRRTHIGERLLERVCYDGEMYATKTAILEVEEGNEAARALYTSLGFVEKARREDYYGQGVAACIYQATLPLDTTALHEQAQARPAASVYSPFADMPERSPEAKENIKRAHGLILAIESSCDETGLAIINDSGEVLANVVATSLDFHARFGGVVPEIASRKHVEAIVGVYEEVMKQAGEKLGCKTLLPKDLVAVGVTAGPGLVGALVVGVAFAKGLAWAAKLKLIAVNHLEGHMLANLYETNDLKPPFIASLVSGGNTLLVHVKAWGSYEILGATIDDAVGEAFDKVSKALGLGYPGGPIISKLAAKGNKRAIHFPRAMMHSGDYSFSLSGLKTAVITYIEGENKAGRPIKLDDLCASFEAAVIDVQVAKAWTAIEQTGVKDFCVGGGVAANKELRDEYIDSFTKRGIRVTVPPMVVCGDNGAMIALVALRNYHAKLFSDFTLDAHPNSTFGDWSCAETPVVSPNWPRKRNQHPSSMKNA